MDAHCKGCKYHHNAGHPKGSRYEKRHNDWCIHFSNVARKIVGHCKLHNGKALAAAGRE
jgi:hypothetical protein